MITTVTLQRQPSTDEGTFGQMFLDGKQIAVTCEPPWKDNQHGISCIPAGTYICKPHDSPKHPNTWQLMDVPGRDEILIHNGNVPIPYTDTDGKLHNDTEGCILVGQTYGVVDGHRAVVGSVLTMDKLRELLPDNFYLTIYNAPTSNQDKE